MDERVKLIKEVIRLNHARLAEINGVASRSRHPMPESDKKRCLALRKSLTWLKKAEYEIIQSLAK